MFLENLQLNSIDELNKYNLVMIDDLGINIDNNIAEYLKAKNISPANLSKMTGIARQNLNEILKGNMKPGVDFALKIAKTLCVSVEDLFELNENAWIKTKSNDDKVLYLDLKTLTIVSSKNIESKNDYIILDTKEIVDKSTHDELYKIYETKCFNEVFEIIDKEFSSEVKKRKERLTRERLVKNFSKICTNRYKKLGERLTPIINNK